MREQLAKSWFDKNSQKYSEIWTSNSSNLDWDNSFLLNGINGFDYFIVPYKKLVTFVSKNISLSRQVIFKFDKANHVLDGSVLETFANDRYLNKDKNLLAKNYLTNNYTSFTGGVIYYDFSYKVLDNPYFSRGNRIGHSMIKIRTNTGFESGHGNRINTTNRINTCYNLWFGIFDENDGTFEPLEYCGIICDEIEGSEFNFAAWANFESGSYGTNGNLEELLYTFINYDIKDSMLVSCLSQVFADVKLLQGGKIGDIIFKLSQSIPAWDWVVKSTWGGTTNAVTYSNSPNGAVTYFNYGNLQNFTELAIVRTMLHEGVHAYLANYLYNDPDAAQLDYPALFTYFNNKIDTATAHHILMGDSLVNSIGDALQQYGQGHGYNLSYQVYHDMAWGGLYSQDTNNNISGVPAFQHLSPAERERIISRNTAENSATTRDTEVPSGSKRCPL